MKSNTPPDGLFFSHFRSKPGLFFFFLIKKTQTFEKKKLRCWQIALNGVLHKSKFLPAAKSVCRETKEIHHERSL